MSKKCYKPGDFDRLLDLAAGHGDLRHLDTCMDCRIELDLYRSFLSRDNIPDGADLADANVRLGEFLEREIVVGKATIVQGPTPAGRRRLDLRRWSPVLVAAGLVCVALLVGYRDDGRMEYPSGVVRDMSVETPALVTSETATVDGFTLAWTGPVDADSYQVVVLNAAMAEVDRFAADLSGEYHLRRSDHDWFLTAGPFFWRMVALRNGDEIARSAVRALEPGH